MRVYGPQLRSRNDDAALVRRLRSGDERAFEEIFKRHRAPLLSYCRHMLSSQDEAEDALQQAFIKAHAALCGGTAPRELRPWLYAIARNCCLSAIAARRPTAPLEEQTPSLAGLSEEVSRREDLRELVAGIGRLPEDQRSALLLSELDDLPHAAIAAIVGCEVSKVKALVYQARSSLLADRDARNTPCLEIREQLSVARGGELRRGPLRRHLRLCDGCRDFQLALGAQRQSLAAVLPVAPSAGLAVAILGHGAAAHTAVAAGGGGLAASGTAATTTTAVGAGAGTSVGVGASAGAGGGTGIGALLGGGLITKLLVGGAVVVLATAGAATVHNREAQAVAHHPTHVQLTSSKTEERPTKEEKPTKEAQSTEAKETKNKATQPTNLEGAPEVTGVDVHTNPSETETGGTHNASS
jgi:RNA polymerase sigma factor (sigma-70 family)